MIAQVFLAIFCGVLFVVGVEAGGEVVGVGVETPKPPVVPLPVPSILGGDCITTVEEDGTKLTACPMTVTMEDHREIKPPKKATEYEPKKQYAPPKRVTEYSKTPSRDHPPKRPPRHSDRFCLEQVFGFSYKNYPSLETTPLQRPLFYGTEAAVARARFHCILKKNIRAQLNLQNTDEHNMVDSGQVMLKLKKMIKKSEDSAMKCIQPEVVRTNDSSALLYQNKNAPTKNK